MVEWRDPRSLAEKASMQGVQAAPRPPVSPTTTCRPRGSGGLTEMLPCHPQSRSVLEGCGAPGHGTVRPWWSVRRCRRTGVPHCSGTPGRPRRSNPEDAIHSSGVETERTEPLLQIGDVIPTKHRRSPVEEAVHPTRIRLRQEVDQVCDPQTPSTFSPRRCWNASSADLVALPNRAAGSPLESKPKSDKPSAHLGDGFTFMSSRTGR